MTATRLRRTGEQARAAILAAAEEEFAAYGIAGARMDRIALAAQASKERLYSYFDDKQTLFQVVLDAVLTRVSTAVEIDGDDLPGYAAALVQYFAGHPDDMRMGMWARLEADAIVSKPDGATHQAHRTGVAAIKRAQQAGHVDAQWDPSALLQLIVATATYWSDEVCGPRLNRGRRWTQFTDQAAANAAEATRRLIEPSS